MKMSFVFIAVLMASASSFAETFVCKHPERPGTPVIKVTIANKVVAAANELLHSNLTGNYEAGKNLKPIGPDRSGFFRFDLGFNYTLDYTLIVDVNNNPASVFVETLDRDDWGGNIVQLVCI